MKLWLLAFAATVIVNYHCIVRRGNREPKINRWKAKLCLDKEDIYRFAGKWQSRFLRWGSVWCGSHSAEMNSTFCNCQYKVKHWKAIRCCALLCSVIVLCRLGDVKCKRSPLLCAWSSAIVFTSKEHFATFHCNCTQSCPMYCTLWRIAVDAVSAGCCIFYPPADGVILPAVNPPIDWWIHCLPNLTSANQQISFPIVRNTSADKFNAVLGGGG